MRRKLTKREHKDGNLRKNYGISLDRAERMLVDQGGLCALCQQPVAFGGTHNTHHDAVVDHSHTTGKVRGIVHGRCNQALGHLLEDPAAFELGAQYLRQHA